MERDIPSKLLDATVLSCVPYTYVGISADRMSDLEKGEEIYMSYGPHPNDFLLIECELSTLLDCFKLSDMN